MNRAMSFMIGSTAALLASNATPATAITINLNGNQYKVTTITGSYDSVESRLKATPWWSNSSSAFSFATQVADHFGLVNDNEGPYFAYNSFPDTGNGPASVGWWYGKPGGPGVEWEETYGRTESVTWAVAAVPFEYDGMVLPIASFGFLLALGVKRKLDTKRFIVSPTTSVNPVDSTVS